MSFFDSKDNLNELLSDFDNSIFELFPSFIHEVNALLKPDKTYDLTNDKDEPIGVLSTELRILALLRLGVAENKEIASFFRFTVQTVYNYRSKAKARAINENTFEEDVKSICKY